MRRPPLSIVAVAVLFLAVGGLDLYRGSAPLFRAVAPHLAGDDALVLGIGVAALVGGVFLLYGHNWARWLLAGWMAFHVLLSIGHAPFQLVAHLVIFGLVTFFLFCNGTAEYFRRAQQR